MKIKIIEVPYKIMKEYFDFECGFIKCPGDKENKKDFCDYYNRMCPKREIENTKLSLIL